MLSLPFSLVGAFGALYVDRRDAQCVLDDRCDHADGPGDQERDPARGLRQPTARRRQRARTALIDAGVTRLRPILMTTAAMVFGMLPVALAFSEGGEVRAPMAICVIGGLLTSMLLTLVVVPVAYSLTDSLLHPTPMQWIRLARSV